MSGHAHCEMAPLPAPLVGACHAGVLERALELSRSLRASGILHALLRDGARTSGVPDCAGWSLVFTGHSLGSGVAAVLLPFGLESIFGVEALAGISETITGFLGGAEGML